MRVTLRRLLLLGLLTVPVTAAAQSRDLSGRTAPPAPLLEALQLSTPLAVTSANSVIALEFVGRHFQLGGARKPAKMLVREARGRWLQVAGLPSSDTRWRVELVTQPYLQQQGLLEFKAVVDGVESNIYRARVGR